jgi:hypothetical protein
MPGILQCSERVAQLNSPACRCSLSAPKETGLHMFIVNRDGIVYQKDIAPGAEKPALSITRFDPDHSCRPVSRSRTGVIGAWN